MKSESRAYPRYTISRELNGQELRPPEYTNEVHAFFHAWAKNISAGALCIVTDEQIRQSALVCCQIRFSEIPVAVPVLMKVQWVRKMNDGRRLRVGLKFLLSATG